MAGHIRGDNYSPTTCVVWNPTVLDEIEKYKEKKGNKNKSRSQVINELVQLGLRHKKLLEKKKAERMTV